MSEELKPCRPKTLEVMARALVRRRIELNHMYESKVRDPEWLQRAEDLAWEYFKVDAESVLDALQAEGMAVVPIAEIQFARDAIEDWAGYADDYYKKRHDLAGDLARVDALLAAVNPSQEKDNE